MKKLDEFILNVTHSADHGYAYSLIGLFMYGLLLSVASFLVE